jgi:hypothetical protein
MHQFDLQKLAALKGYPAVSILMPTHRTWPDSQQDPIRLRNLVAEVERRLLAKFPRRAVAPLLAQVEQQVGGLDFRNLQAGLAIFASAEYTASFLLPFPVRQRVVIDQSFAIRDIVFSLNRRQRYWLLVLSEKPSRLYQGLDQELEEITQSGFPLTHTGPGGSEPLPGGFGIRRSAYRDEYDRKFFRQVDAALGEVLGESQDPLFVAGVDRNLAFFQEVSQRAGSVAGTLQGSYDSTPLAELVARVWPLVEVHAASQRQQAHTELEAAAAVGQIRAGLAAIWPAAIDGRGALLLVERDVHAPARLTQDGRSLQPVANGVAIAASEGFEDAIDELIEIVLEKGGRVVFTANGRLEGYGRIALVLRY